MTTSFGTPSGIRTRDLHLERVMSWATRRWGPAPRHYTRVRRKRQEPRTKNRRSRMEDGRSPEIDPRSSILDLRSSAFYLLPFAFCLLPFASPLHLVTLSPCHLVISVLTRPLNPL